MANAKKVEFTPPLRKRLGELTTGKADNRFNHGKESKATTKRRRPPSGTEWKCCQTRSQKSFQFTAEETDRRKTSDKEERNRASATKRFRIRAHFPNKGAQKSPGLTPPDRKLMTPLPSWENALLNHPSVLTQPTTPTGCRQIRRTTDFLISRFIANGFAENRAPGFFHHPRARASSPRPEIRTPVNKYWRFT